MTDDAVEAHKMPLLDHLVELRSRLLKSVAALFVAFLVCFFFAEPIYSFLTEPLASILREPFSPTVDRLVKSDGVLFEGRSFRLLEGEQRW